MSTTYLSHLIAFFGVVVALVAASLAVPTATRHLGRQMSTRITHNYDLIAGLVRRLLARLAPRPVVPTGTASGQVCLGTATVGSSRTTSWAVDAFGSLDTRVDRLEQLVAELLHSNIANRDAIAAEATARRDAVDALAQQMAIEAASIHARLDSLEQENLKVDATALPVVGLGIILSGVPDLLALVPTIGIASIAVALTFLARALIRFYDDGYSPAPAT